MAKWLKITIISILIAAIIVTGVWLLYYFGVIDKTKQYTYEELQDKYEEGVNDEAQNTARLQIQIDELESTIALYQSEISNKNRTITSQNTQITNLNNEISNLQNELQNKVAINTVNRKLLTITFDGEEYTNEIQTNTENIIATSEIEYSGSFNDLEVLGPWNSVNDINIKIDDITYYTFEINDAEISTEPTIETVRYNMANGVSPEIHLFLNITEVTANQENMFKALSSVDSIYWFTEIRYSLNDNNEFTSLVISTRILGEIE